MVGMEGYILHHATMSVCQKSRKHWSKPSKTQGHSEPEQLGSGGGRGLFTGVRGTTQLSYSPSPGEKTARECLALLGKGIDKGSVSGDG